MTYLFKDNLLKKIMLPSSYPNSSVFVLISFYHVILDDRWNDKVMSCYDGFVLLVRWREADLQG